MNRHIRTDTRQWEIDFTRWRTGRCRTMIRYHLDRYIEEANVDNETHLSGSYSLICVNKNFGRTKFCSRQIDFYLGRMDFFIGKTTLSRGETTLSWVETVREETDLSRHYRNSIIQLPMFLNDLSHFRNQGV